MVKGMADKIFFIILIHWSVKSLTGLSCIEKYRFNYLKALQFDSFPKLELSICSIKNTFNVLLLKGTNLFQRDLIITRLNSIIK